MTDCFKILGVTELDSISFIKKRYRVLLMKTHPDKGGNPDDFNKIQEAYKEIIRLKKSQSTNNSFDQSSDVFFKRIFGNSTTPWNYHGRS